VGFDFFSPSNVLAVVGVSSNREKYGYKIWRALKNKGYRVYGVNVKGYQVDGERLYPSLSSLPEKPDVVIMVIPPGPALEVLKEAHRLGIGHVWFQPGSESEEALAFCREKGMECVAKACFVRDGLGEDLERLATFRL